MKIKDIPEKERPRERLLRVGVENLTDVELLTIVISTGSKNLSSYEIALRLLKNYNLNTIFDLGIDTLSKEEGIGLAKAIKIKASIELGRRSVLTKNIDHKRYVCPEDIYNYVKGIFTDLKQEKFYTIYLNNKNEIIETKLLFMGTIDRSVVHPRDIFKYAYLLSASSIICVHNHPSDDVEPSFEDIRVTKALEKLGELAGIPIIDHLIVGRTNYYSFKDNKMLNT